MVARNRFVQGHTNRKADKMREIEADKFNGVLCFGGEDWWYHNRGHIDMQLMRRFAKKGTVVYVNSIVMQKPNFSEGRKFLQRLIRKTKSIFTGLKKSDVGFWVYSPFSLPVHHVSWLRPLNALILRWQLARVIRKLSMLNPLVWVACPAACDVAIKIRKSKLVYQRTDRYEEFPGVDSNIIKRYDQKLKANADITVYVNSVLYEEESKQCKRALYLDHGVDYEMFAAADNVNYQPDDIIDIPMPIVGFYGSFGKHTTDIKLLEKLADMLPDMSFVFIGPTLPECAKLKSKDNVWMIDQKPYEQIPYYGKFFDVAIMPWRQNRWISGCNPIKLKEYLALGKPIVSTPFNELNKYLEVVYEARTAEEFVMRIKQALKEDCPEKIISRRNAIKEFSWDSKAQKVLDEIFVEINE